MRGKAPLRGFRAMRVALRVLSSSEKLAGWVTGGVLDFYFFMGPTPHAVLEQLTYIVGRPFMPPYWSLGLMNSK